MRGYGYIQSIHGDNVTIDLDTPKVNGLAIVPISMFGDGERNVMFEGSFIEAEVDDTLLVTDVRLMQVACWTQREIDEARAEANELAAHFAQTAAEKFWLWGQIGPIIVVMLCMIVAIVWNP